MKFDFELTGITPILFHADDVEQSDLLTAWRKDSNNKKHSVPGDDRSPPWTWMTYLYSDGARLSMPSDNLMVTLRNGASKIPMKRQETFKRVSQSGLFIEAEFCEFEGPSGPVSMADLERIREDPYAEQARAVKDLGFSLYTKRAKVGDSKHVRCRARFDDWRVRGRIEIFDDIITPEILKRMFDIAGAQSGLLDWRPSSPKSPGRFGKFSAALKRAK